MGYFMIKDQNLRSEAEKYNLVSKENSPLRSLSRNRKQGDKKNHVTGEEETGIKLAQVT